MEGGRIIPGASTAVSYTHITWDGGKDVDAVLTTREVARMFKRCV